MIKSFSDKKSKQFYIKGNSKNIPLVIQKTALRKLDYINSAFSLDDLKTPPANHLKKLSGELKDFYSIRINKQYRIVFKFQDENAYDVKIIDYH